MTAVSIPALRARVDVPRWAWFAGIAIVASILWIIFHGTFTQERSDDGPFFQTLNGLRDFIRDNRENVVFAVLFTVPRVGIDALIELLTSILRSVGWPALLAVAGTIGLIAGGWRLAAAAVVGFAALGILGLWDASVDTLGAIIGAVSISFAIGVPLGILVARNDGVRRVLTPILDVMQIMPTFAYLAPFVLFFGIGPAAAAIVTLIYAMPAAIRITALGIRRVPGNSVEAGESLGATGRQLLTKVRLPLARREIALALNQTLMLAMSMIVITALINAPGLGQNTLKALIKNDVGSMFDAGIAIVILAIVLDRLTEALGNRFDPRHKGELEARALPKRVVRGALALTVALVIVGVVLPAAQEFPDVISFSFRQPINAFVDWLRTDVSWLTGALKDAITYTILNPLETILTEAPFWLVIATVAGVTALVTGIRPAIVGAVCLGLIFAMGLWADSMETLMQVLVATAITLLIGVLLGISSARSDRISAALRPILDVAQTMPSFVYLLPAFVLFDVGRFTAIVAAVIFALPPVIRLVDVGIRSVPPTMIEAATSSGSTARQILTKVQLPVARPALQLAANQAVILVLSMVVVGGLVGGGALGYDVVSGFSQGHLFGLGLAAGIALVLLGIMLDRLTQGAGGRAPTRLR
jgi:glycine betaine/proline transport system permease protein